MILKQTDKIKKDGYWHEERRVNITRIYGGIAFKGKFFACLLGEEMFLNQSHYFIIAEAEAEQGDSIIDLLDVVRRLDGLFSVQRWFGKLDENTNILLANYNRREYNNGVKSIKVWEVPGNGEWIDEAVSIVHMLTRPLDKRLHFFNESMIVSEMKSNPQTGKIRADEYPRLTALSNVVGGMMRYSAEKVSPSLLEPEPEGDF